MVGAGLIKRLLHERVIGKTTSEIGEAGGRGDRHDVGIEAVEGAADRRIQRTTPGGAGVDVVVLPEILAIFEVPVRDELVCHSWVAAEVIAPDRAAAAKPTITTNSVSPTFINNPLPPVLRNTLIKSRHMETRANCRRISTQDNKKAGLNSAFQNAKITNWLVGGR